MMMIGLLLFYCLRPPRFGRALTLRNMAAALMLFGSVRGDRNLEQENGNSTKAGG